MRRLVVGIFFISITGLVGCALKTTHTRGIPNLHQVRQDFYRSGQPTTLPEWRYLHDELGVTDSFKLDFDSEGTDDLARLAGIVVHPLSIEPSTDPDGLVEAVEDLFKRPAADRIAELKRLIIEVKTKNAENIRFGKKLRVALIHCKNGHDRTGLGSGFVRVLYDGWTKKAAWKEMRRLGFHPGLVGLVREWSSLGELTP